MTKSLPGYKKRFVSIQRGSRRPFPIVVELADPYYVHGGYHYYHNNDQWYYSQSQGGPRVHLPRDRYPKEVRYKGKGQDKGKGWIART